MPRSAFIYPLVAVLVLLFPAGCEALCAQAADQCCCPRGGGCCPPQDIDRCCGDPAALLPPAVAPAFAEIPATPPASDFPCADAGEPALAESSDTPPHGKLYLKIRVLLI